MNQNILLIFENMCATLGIKSLFRKKYKSSNSMEQMQPEDILHEIGK